MKAKDTLISSRILIPSSRLTMPQYIEGVAKGWVFRHIKAPEGTVWVKIIDEASGEARISNWAFVHNEERVTEADWRMSATLMHVGRDE